MRFKDRKDAGERLAESLKDYKGQDCVVYALPRGGVILGEIVAKNLDAPLDLLIARKIGHPDWPEYAIGAVTETGDPILNEAETGTIDDSWLQAAIAEQRQEAARRRKAYLADYPPVDPENKVAVVVDDGVATGLTLKAAVHELKNRHPRMIVIAVPVAAYDVAVKLKDIADEVRVLHAPKTGFGAVGAYYDQFEQVDDDTVTQVIARFKHG